jgi:hypothetical protein
MKNQHGGRRTPGPGKKLGPPFKPATEKYKGIYVKLPPYQIDWLNARREATGQPRNNYLVEMIDAAIAAESDE